MDKWRSNKAQSSSDDNKWRSWEMLDPEILALIFTRIPIDELARTMPFVCRGWREMIAGPYCWADIDITEWCKRVNEKYVTNATVSKLVPRSCNTLRRLSAYLIGNKAFSVIASFGIHLKVLEIRFSDVNDNYIEMFSQTLTALQVLDISYCYNITSKGIAILGNNCSSLIQLQRNMLFIRLVQNNVNEDGIDEDEALAVANTMPGLQKLEFACGLFSDYGLNAILSNCKALSSLDIRGCSSVKLDGSVGRRCSALESFVDPSYVKPASDDDDDDDDDANDD